MDENLTDDDVRYNPDDDSDDYEVVDECENCGCNIYGCDDDGSGLCDECQWWQEVFDF